MSGRPPVRTALGYELSAATDTGAAMVAAATCFAEDFAAGAISHDRDGTFAGEHLEKLQADRFLVAPIPAELGGGGVSSIHDVLVASSRLARGDPSTTIGVNMHFAVVLNIVRSWRIALAREDRRAAAIADGLRGVVAADVVFAAAASEPSPQDLTRPASTATRAGDGWAINGRKVFATMGPAATILNVAVTFVEPRDGSERYGFALVPTTSPGVVFHDDWDALGMRASASGSVSFHDVRVDARGLRDGFPAGVQSAPFLERYLASGAFHAAASLGIAESAQATVVTALRRRADAAVADAHIVTELAANVVDLAAMRASLDRAGHVLDEYVKAHPTGGATIEEAQAVFAEVQASKALLTATAVRVVDRALALSGGAGYLAQHPLAKAWRDVRAGAFMHPLGANRSASFLARTALGVRPD